MTRSELAEMLGCGLRSADAIAEAAQARIWIGRKVLISVNKIQTYLDEKCR